MTKTQPALNRLRIFFITLLSGGILSQSAALAQSCSCDNVITASGAISIPAGQTWCVNSGSIETSSLSMTATSKLCIKSGASFKVNGVGTISAGATITNAGTFTFNTWPTTFNFNLINSGSTSLTGGNDFNGYIENSGTYSCGYMQNYNGDITNSSTFDVSGSNLKGGIYNTGYLKFSGSLNPTGSKNIINKGRIVISQGMTFASTGYFQNDSTITFSNSITINSGAGNFTNAGSLTTTDFTNNSNSNFNNTGTFNGSAFNNNGNGSVTTTKYFKTTAFANSGSGSFYAEGKAYISYGFTMNSSSGNFTSKGAIRTAGFTYSGIGKLSFGDSSVLSGNLLVSSSAKGLNNTGYLTAAQMTYEGSGAFRNSGTEIFSNLMTIKADSFINSGRFSRTGGDFVYNNINGIIENSGKLYVSTVTFTGKDFFNRDSFVVENGATFNISGTFTNTSNGKTRFNMNTPSSNFSFYSNLDNSGFMEIAQISNLSAVINNYGYLRIQKNVANISTATYLTNDSLIFFDGVDNIQFNGPMLTNNGRMMQTGSTPGQGNFKLNQNINQCYNNGIIVCSGEFQVNATDAVVVNNCRLVCKNFLNHAGKVTNNGLIWATNAVENNNANAKFVSSATGFLRGVSFVNSGYVSGYGGFYFTGNTKNDGGHINGASATATIAFYDAVLSGTDSIVDSNAGGDITNVTRPSTLTPLDTNSYNCTAPPSVAGYPPSTKPFDIAVCNVDGDITINLSDSVTVNTSGSGTFTLLYSSIKLFDADSAGNPTNNTTNLVISGKGTFSANTSTGVITFTPAVGFSGSAHAQYRISNSRSGDPVTYPSGKTAIVVSLGGGIAAPTRSIGD